MAYAEPPFPNYEAWTDPATCTIYLSREDAARFRVEPEFRCAVIVHEWGHMNGRQHSPDPKNVMYANVTNYWRCQRPAERHVTLMVGDPATGLVFY